MTVVAEGFALVMTTTDRNGAGRVSEDKDMLRTGCSALVERRRRCYPRRGASWYRGLGSRDTSAYANTNVFTDTAGFLDSNLSLGCACIPGRKSLCGFEYFYR